MCTKSPPNETLSEPPKISPLWEVIVGNIGHVESTHQMGIALITYAAYKKQSIANYGRAAGEPVTMLKDGEILYEHQ